MTNPTGKASARRLPNEPVTRQKLAERTGLNRFNPAQGGVRGMRIMAGGLLVAMAGVFLFARTQVPFHPAWGFVRAFAEAAMVGGLADWFAVTALFRSAEHTSELQSLMRISYAVFCLT